MSYSYSVSRSNQTAGSNCVSRSQNSSTDSNGVTTTTIIEVDNQGVTTRTTRVNDHGKITEDVVKSPPSSDNQGFSGGVISSDGTGNVSVTGWHGSSTPSGSSISVRSETRSVPYRNN